MASITTAKSGKFGTVTATAGTGDVGSEITEWSADLTVEDLDAVNTSGLGFYDSVDGINKCTGSFTAIGDSTPQQGTVVALTLAVGVTTGDQQISGDALITSVAISSPVQGSVVTYACSFVYRGAFVDGTVT